MICEDKKEWKRLRDQTLRTINQKFFQGVMPPSWYTNIDIWFDKYGFEPDIMIAIFQECYDHEMLGVRYISRVAEDRCNAGIKTLDDLKSHILM